MKISFARLSVAAAILVASFAPQSATAVGYVNRTFNVGDNLFVNPLHFAFNTLSNVFAFSPVPHGTQVSLWNPMTLSFDTTATFNAGNGSWSDNFTLYPGTGARLTTSVSFQNTFIGDVLDHDGQPYGDTFHNPPPYAGPDGIFLLGDKSPIVNTGNDIFLHILGRDPNVGEKVQNLMTTSTYLGDGLWDNVPVLGVSEAAFLHVAVPEPAITTIVLLGLGVGRYLRRKA
jgi:hypothetical protein